MLRTRVWLPGLLATMVVSCATRAPDEGPKPEVTYPDGYDVSQPLSEMAKIPVPEVFNFRAHEAEPARAIPHMRQQSLSQQHDPVVQNAIGTANIPSTTINFEGMGAGLAVFTVQSAPPDTDGDIGPNHYVQIVNSSVTIFSRAGAKLLGPVATNTFFNGFSGACATTNDGDGVVRYDRYADRWVITQHSAIGGSGPFFQCIAVSTSPDPTSTYNRYQFSYTAFNGDPKIALWPTQGGGGSYIITSDNEFGGAKVCKFDRAKMLIGAVATQQCWDTVIGGLLAADVDGATLPPAGSPHYLLALDTNRLAFFTMTSAGLMGPTFITTAAFTPLCNGGTCVKQPGTTQQLDSLADRLMNRLVYRNFGDHEALLVSHAVTAGAGGGVRFYELRTPATTPTIFQQGTYAPDAGFRWMSSMAFDHVGNIGMGFSISSSTVNPSIRYTGRLVADAPGTMGQGEATLVAGTGSQTANLSRWGDYSSLNIDPTDDCTFWYTQEYMSASGTFNWHTRVGAFKFANCTQAPTVSITSPANGSAVCGTITVSANASDNDGTVASVKFDLPDGTSVTDTTAPFATTFDTTKVVDGGGYVFRAIATDNQGATSVATVTVTVANGGGGCLNNTFSATGLPLAIPDNNATGITSSLAVTGNGTVTSLTLSLNITHAFPGDLVVTLLSPSGTSFIVSNRVNHPNNIIINSLAITAFNGQAAAGTWKLKVQDLASLDVGTLNSWSIKIVGNCTGAVHWSGSATPNLPTIDNGTACTTLTVAPVAGADASVAKLDISGSHAFRSILRGTLAHNGVFVEAFPLATFPTGSGTFSLTNRSEPDFTGDPAGTWTLCIVDTDAFGDTGTLNTWAVHD